MAKKEEDKTMSRLLTKTIPGIQPVIAPEGTLSIDGQNTGWEIGSVSIDGANYHVLFYGASFDLSGYSLKDMTLFLQGVLVQHCPTIVGNASFFTANIVSTEPLGIDDFSISSNGKTWALPGNADNHYSLQQILFGDCTFFAEDTTINTVRPVTSSQWGSGASTARDKMYCAVAIAIAPSGPGQILYPDTSFVIPSVIAKEPELEYIMRLARSVETI